MENASCKCSRLKRFIEYKNHDLVAVAVMSSEEPASQVLTFKDLIASNLQLVRISRDVGQVFSSVAQVFVGLLVLMLLQSRPGAQTLKGSPYNTTRLNVLTDFRKV